MLWGSNACFIRDIRNEYPHLSSTPAYLTFDGEQVQINVYRDESLQDLFKDLNTYLGKLSASCTAIQQPCDRGNIFKGAKKSNRGINDNDVVQNVDMNDLIIKVINSHEQNKSSDQQMSSSHKNMLRHGLLRVQKALQKTLNTQTISDSFKNTGMNPLSLVMTLQQCRDNRSDDVDKMIIKKMPYFIKIFKDNGVIKDSDLIASGIPSAMAKETKNPKDTLTISHQRAVLLSRRVSHTLESSRGCEGRSCYSKGEAKD